ncbi:S-adenosyl-L-methionine-dependent methyltransferase [Aspergillus alliaceus]|uniref:S-adenosyl-L-methionine-dependent methyltransferase n=1 Tax=Petromyces alliaceus TaxID=209559 RepID=UPI0012A46F58|nr:S-adenosyl-L-methionine-dependent methyltransferase [Aspergillus alliaceus]KAB8232632.1 S-adenosyl-L-methionine-dependent methyltransferase [Aspergillus alliaceus]
MFQEVDCDSLSSLFDTYIKNKTQLGSGNFLVQSLPRLTMLLRPSNDPQNAHMNYSCAHWSGDPTETLETAQKKKVQLLIQKAQISLNHHILDPIRRPEEDRRERDPRAWPGGSIATGPEGNGGYYDRIISIGMFEHVGAEYLDEYFRVISSLLHPSHGVMVIDGITRTNKGSKAELEATSVMNIGPHYGKSLFAWRDNFLRNWGQVEAAFRDAQLDASDREVEAFRRKWLYYFIYCEAGFRLRLLGNYTVVAAKIPKAGMEYDPRLGDMLMK